MSQEVYEISPEKWTDEIRETYDIADSLYAGGWRSEDFDDLIDVYGITEEEAQKICDALQYIEESQS